VESEAINMIIENVKMDKTILVETYICEESCNYYKNATIIVKRIGMSLFLFIVTIGRTQRCKSMNTKH
jgi:hypothetical protein